MASAISIATDLLEVLLDLHKNSRSGVLRIERKLEKKQLILSNGLLAFAESNLVEEHLVRIMVTLGILPRIKVNEIASFMKSGKTSEEAVFTLSGLEAQDVEKGRREQATIILASLLSWNGYTLHFYPGEGLVRYHLNLGLSLPELLIHSARRAVSNHLIPTPPGFLQAPYAIAEEFAEKAMELPLNSAEAYVFSLLHNPMSANDLFPLIPASEAKPEELLLRLFALGLIKPFSPPASDSAAELDPCIQLLDDMQSRFESAGLYEILSVPTDATQADIQASYHDLAKQFHPDHFQSKEFSSDIHSKAQQVFTYINEAYVTLKNPAARAVYDENRLTKESKAEAVRKAGSGAHTDEKMAEELFSDGRAQLAKGDFEKAAERLNGCVFLRPEKAIYRHYLGIAQSDIPRLRKSAEQHLLKAIDLDNASIASRLELAKLYIKVALRRKAELQLQEILRWEPEHKEANKLIAELEKLDNAKTSPRIKTPFARVQS
jgi:curved DNA-binding protein CbpA